MILIQEIGIFPELNLLYIRGPWSLRAPLAFDRKRRDKSTSLQWAYQLSARLLRVEHKAIQSMR